MEENEHDAMISRAVTDAKLSKPMTYADGIELAGVVMDTLALLHVGLPYNSRLAERISKAQKRCADFSARMGA